MTGEDDGAEVSPVDGPPDWVQRWTDKKDRWQRKQNDWRAHHGSHQEESDTTWPSCKEHVIQPLRSALGAAPDVFVCTDRVEGAVPPEVARVYEISAGSQFERAHLCYRKVLAARPYDFYIKIRPDFRFLKDFPSVASMRRDRIHTRFKSAMGIRNLTSSHFSWEVCNKDCNGDPRSSVGYANDDMIWVAPAAVSDRVFASESEAVRWRERFEAPPNWPRLPGGAEGAFTQHLLGAGVSTEPLAVVGYPIESLTDHKALVVRCADKPVKKRCILDEATRRLS